MIDKSIIKQYLDLGLRLFPLSDDKRPPSGFVWRIRIMKLDDFDNFKEYPFLALICGTESGNIEVIDIDSKHDDGGALFSDYQQLICAGDEDLFERLVIQKTVSNGFHFIYKCDDPGGSIKLANKAPENKKSESLIETKGSGGYIVISPSPGYEFLNHDLSSIPLITMEERNYLFACARLLDEAGKIAEEPKALREARYDYVGRISPFDAYNERGDVEELLEAHGWKRVFKSGRNIFYKREGSDNKYGANYHLDKKVFYVFSSSSVFEAEKGYSPCQVYAKLLHNDDWKATALDLISKGFGEKGIRILSDPFSRKDKTVEAKDFILPTNSDDTEISNQRKGLIRMGISFGYKELNKYFVYKQGNFVCFNGYPNVGKTTVVLWLLFLLAKLYQKKILIYTAENETEDMRVDLIEYYAGYKIDYMTDVQFEEASNWISEHFDFFDNDRNYTAQEFFGVIEAMEKHYDIVFADPYSAFIVGNADWGYHVDIKNRINTWKKRTKTSVWISHHTIADAARQKDKKTGYPPAPKPVDSENGQMWWAGSDDWVTIHRNPHHPDLWMWSELHVRKIKRNKTGGQVTEFDSPFLLRLMLGGIEYQSALGERPHVNGIPVEEPKQAFLQPNINFYEVEKDEVELSPDVPF